MVRCFLAIMLLCCSSFGQVTVEKQRAIIGVTNPKIVGSRIFVGPDSNPTTVEVGLVEVSTDWKFSLIRIYRDGQKIDLEKVSDNSWIAVGKGRYRVDAILFDNEKGIWNNEFEFELGGAAPPPKPDDPKPDDPKPPPHDPPEPIGLAAIAKAHPVDAANSQRLAAAYQSGADSLFGIGQLLTIDQAFSRINQVFESKVCPDNAICQQWGEWKRKVDTELRAMQQKKQFDRNDWFQALKTVAEGLR